MGKTCGSIDFPNFCHLGHPNAQQSCLISIFPYRFNINYSVSLLINTNININYFKEGLSISISLVESKNEETYRSSLLSYWYHWKADVKPDHLVKGKLPILISILLNLGLKILSLLAWKTLNSHLRGFQGK